ncbi:glutathione S-transferase C-terminal domain-containing protein [uncultured Marinobacter sp.]|uniref:glutathione S-transferase C-terminal domain-containing protein n=2 Tax=Marinobacter TaxID=2742 RepID=UPI0030DC3B0D
MLMVLWDRQTGTIVNNESVGIVRMLNSAFAEIVDQAPDLYPEHLAGKINTLNDYIYKNLNNSVYQAGFASSQAAYNEAYGKVFAALDELESRLADGRAYLFGDRLTETDIRLFVTLVRFDAAYHGLFKCNRNTPWAMPYLHAYTLRILALEGIASTVNIDHIKAGYYSIKALNPTGIVQAGPSVQPMA